MAKNLFKKSRDLSKTTVISLDPSINCTGWAIFVPAPAKQIAEAHKRSLCARPPRDGKFMCGVITSPKNSDIFNRMSSIVDQVEFICRSYGVRCAFIEVPPQTLYVNKRASRDTFISRAQHVFKVYATAYSIATYLRLHSKIDCRCILPQRWQPRIPKQYGGKSSKQKALAYANAILIAHGYQDRLKTKEDENIADAVALLDICLQQYCSGE